MRDELEISLNRTLVFVRRITILFIQTLVVLLAVGLFAMLTITALNSIGFYNFILVIGGILLALVVIASAAFIFEEYLCPLYDKMTAKDYKVKIPLRRKQKLPRAYLRGRKDN